MDWFKKADEEPIAQGPQKTLTQAIGAGVECTLTETEDGVGFIVEIEGSLISGNGIEQTMKDIEKAWASVEI